MKGLGATEDSVMAREVSRLLLNALLHEIRLFFVFFCDKAPEAMDLGSEIPIDGSAMLTIA